MQNLHRLIQTYIIFEKTFIVIVGIKEATQALNEAVCLRSLEGCRPSVYTKREWINNIVPFIEWDFLKNPFKYGDTCERF